MKSAFITTFGGPEVVSLRGVEPLALQAGEVAVRIEVAALNPLDVKMIAGYLQQVFPVTFPYAPGTDFSGVVESVGPGVAALRPGDRVMGRTAPSAGGAIATQLVIAAQALCVVPAEMSFEQAASLPTVFGTARLALFGVGRLQRGQRVLIHAAAGGVGSMAVQQAHHAGAYVIATASERNIELVKSLGADEVIDYRHQDFARLRGIDLVLDTVGGATLENSWAVLRAPGRIASIVEFGIQGRDGHSGESVFFADAAPFLPEAVRQFREGLVQVITDSIFPLEDARAALEKLATGHARGKVLVRMSR